MENFLTMVNTAESQLMETFDSILDIPKEFFDSVPQNSIMQLFSETIKAQKDGVIQDLTKQIKEQHLTKIQVAQARESSHTMITVIKEEVLSQQNLHPSQVKLIEYLSDIFIQYIDEAIDASESYDCTVDFELLHPDARLPEYAGPKERGADIFTIEKVIIKPRTYGNLIHTGIAACIPENWGLDVRPKSGISCRTAARIGNPVGTIDETYVDEIMIIMDNFSDDEVVFNKGQKFAQLLLEPVYRMRIREAEKSVKELKGETMRQTTDGNVAGFGFTGV